MIVPPPNTTKEGLYFIDSDFTNVISYLVGYSEPNPLKATKFLCTSYDDSLCKAAARIDYVVHLSYCSKSTDIDCIAGLFAIKPDGTRVEGVFIHGMPDVPTNEFQGESTVGLPSSGVDGLWQIPGVIHGGGSDTYAVVSQLSSYGQTKVPGATLTNRFELMDLSAGIFPVQVLSGTFTPRKAVIQVNADGSNSVAIPGGVTNNLHTGKLCVVTSVTECAVRQRFPMDYTFGLSMRISQKISGWLHGRIQEPVISFAGNEFGTNLTIQARPVTVPIVLAWADRIDQPQVMQSWSSQAHPGRVWTAEASGATSISLLQALLPFANDSSVAEPSAWIFRTLRNGELSGSPSCILNSKTLAGFVSTNSTVYSAGPPTFNPVTESLDYKLVAPHLTSKGEVFKGVYTLGIRSDVARCIYKFTNAPIKATISVTDEAGQSSVAVESMSEHDGWIYLSASGFTFSSPTVHVKLIGTPIPEVSTAPVVTPTPTPTPTPTASSTPSLTPTTIEKPIVKKTTITCIKGKTVKKVTANSPKCPKGYKKK
ncbi:MAG: hypothetical protein F2954_00720 [Actinobacteria bacterium]|nr:hypothetical protein [Actinomycetota bacterium]